MRRALAALVALLVLAGGARAAITVVSTSTLATGAVAPPVSFSLGAGGAEARFFSWSLSPNATVVSGAMLGRAGADWYAKDVLRIANARAGAQTVTLSAAQLVNAQLDVFQWFVYDGATLVATLDLESASPGATFALPGAATYRLDARLDLADGTGAHNAPTSFELRLRVGAGGVLVTHTTSASTLSVGAVEVPFGRLAAGSGVGANATNASASINAPTVIASNQNALYLNNTGTSAWWVKVVLSSSASISDVTTGNVGVDNGTLVEHVKIASGAVTQSSGSYQRLEPSSTNHLYVRSLQELIFDGATLDVDVHLSPTSAGDSYLVSKARLTLT